MGNRNIVGPFSSLASFPKASSLINFYRKSRNSIDAGKKEVCLPLVSVIPSSQRDMTRVAMIINILRLQGIEIGRATAEIKVKDGSFPAAHFVIKTPISHTGDWQKYFWRKQDFPDQNLRTYDDTGLDNGLDESHRSQRNRR
jgi:hypothetical protein